MGLALTPAPVRLSALLDALRTLHPPRHVLHVGAGDGSTLPPYVDWGALTVQLVEARAECLTDLRAQFSGSPGCTVLHACVGAVGSAGEFHEASNPAESGLVAPERLTALWRNLHTVGRSPVDVVTLEALLGDEAANRHPDWLVVDCLPAVAVLEGAGALLEGVDVVLARALAPDGPQSLPEAGAEDVDHCLARHGFRHLVAAAEWHPSLQQRAYVRDWRLKASTSQALLDELRSDSEQRLAQAETHAEALREALADRSHVADLLEQERSSADAMVAMVREELRSATTTGQLARTALADMQAEAQRLTEELARRDVLAASMQARIQQLQQALEAREVEASQALDQAQELGLRMEQLARTALADTQVEAQRLTEELARRDVLAASMQARIQQLQQALEAREVEASQAFEQAQALGLRMELEGRQTRLQISQLESEAQAHARESESASRAMRALQETLEGQSQQLVREAEARAALQAESSLVQARLDALLAEIERANRDLDTSRAQGQSLEASVQTLSSAAEELRASGEAARAALQAMQLERDALDASRVSLDTELQELRTTLVAERAEQQSLLGALAQSGLELQGREEALESSRNALDAAQDQLKAIEAELLEQRRQTQHWQSAHGAGEQLLAATQERATLAQRQLADTQAQLDSARLAQAHVTAERDEHARVSRERLAHIEALEHAAAERAKQLAAMQEQRGELEARQRLLDQEIVKAEAQIELIKDVVLREKAF